MTRIGRYAVRAGLVLVGLALVGLLAAVVWIDRLVKLAVEEGGSAATGVAVTLASASARLSAAELSLLGFAIHNPAGFRPEPFVSVGRVQARCEGRSLFADAIVIEELVIEDVRIHLEHANGRTNFGSILDRLKSDPAQDVRTTSPAGKARSLVVRHVLVTGVNASVHVPGLSESSAGVTIPRLELRDFRTDGGTREIVGALTGTIVDALLTATLDQGAASLPREIARDLERQVDALKSKAEGVLDAARGIKDLFRKQ